MDQRSAARFRDDVVRAGRKPVFGGLNELNNNT
jgi:hypothetical protein